MLKKLKKLAEKAKEYRWPVRFPIENIGLYVNGCEPIRKGGEK